MISKLSFRSLFTLSRPRFWIYELGTYLLGVLAVLPIGITPLQLGLLIAFGIYFLFPANLLIYGVNDIFDYDTDKLNPKKVEYEALLLPKYHRHVWQMIAVTNLPFLALLFWVPDSAKIAFALFIFFAFFYSAYPLRAKIRPGFDSLFSASHYVVTGVFGYFLVGGVGVPWAGVIAGILWATAMHAFSAVPDIEADSGAGLRTIATWLGAPATLAVCGLFYFASSVLAAIVLGPLPLVFGLLYVLLMLFAWLGRLSGWDDLIVYRWFPVINLGVGFVLALLLMLRLF